MLSAAARGGNLTLLKYFVEEKNYPVSKKDRNLLLSSAIGGNVDLIKYLIYEKNLRKTSATQNEGNTALHCAAMKGKLEAVKFFIDSLNYEVDIRNREDETPAHSAAMGGSLSAVSYTHLTLPTIYSV